MDMDETIGGMTELLKKATNIPQQSRLTLNEKVKTKKGREINVSVSGLNPGETVELLNKSVQIIKEHL